MEEIKFDRRNYRKHNAKNKKLIKKSLAECGAGRSIVIDKDGEIIGGNGIYEAWGNKPVKVIETDGSELVVVKRTDLSYDDEKRKKLAVMDNSVSDWSEFDTELMKQDFKIKTLEEMGVNIGGKKIDTEKIDLYNLKNAEITYQPNDTRWKVDDLYKFNDELLEKIEKVKDEELKKMLKVRLCWLAEFRYDRIADYYCNQASKEEQEIFEKLALVLLDKDQMIQNGFSELMEFVADGFEKQKAE